MPRSLPCVLSLTPRRFVLGAALLFILACHSDPFIPATYTVGPSSTGTTVRLTYNADQDYWPIWNEDGSGILYAFVDSTLASSIAHYTHRCIGLLPSGGGTRIWQWCDNRAAMADSDTSFPAFALGADGRLLYAESAAIRSFAFVPGETALWLADSIHPWARRKLFSLPVTVGDSTISWLADLSWTGPATFIGMGQQYLPASHCVGTPSNIICPTLDTIYHGGLLIRGTINATGASLAPIAGTAGATSYSQAAGGATIVFTRRDSPNLFSVPAAGGAASIAAVVTPAAGTQILGVSCRGMTCVVAVASITPWAPANPGPPVDIATIDLGTAELREVSLLTGASTVIAQDKRKLFSSPLMSRASGDVVVQSGRTMGHLQTFGTDTADLIVLKGIVQ